MCIRDSYTGEYICPNCGASIYVGGLNEFDSVYCGCCRSIFKCVAKGLQVWSCETCGLNDETCSHCNECDDKNKWVPKATQMSGADNMHKSQTINDDYRPESLVSKRKTEIEEIVSAHWNYVEKLIRSGADTTRLFTFEDVMAMRKWDYTSAATHFYGHGWEDGEKAFAEKTLNRLKGA